MIADALRTHGHDTHELAPRPRGRECGWRRGGGAAQTRSARPMLREADRHPLHQGERVWLETNCYVDLWIELLHDFGFDPRAALGFTVLQAPR